MFFGQPLWEVLRAQVSRLYVFKNIATADENICARYRLSIYCAVKYLGSLPVFHLMLQPKLAL